MKSPVPVLSPLLRSDAQGEMLALLLLHPGQEYSLSEVSRRVSASLPVVHAEVARLLVVGLVADRRVGQARLVRAVPEHLLYRPLVDLLELTYGPAAVLPDVLGALPGVGEAFIYGSWAARRMGEPGGAPRDVDVLVVGVTSRSALAAAAAAAGRRLHREVNITRVSPQAWEDGQDAFVRTVRSRPLVPLTLVRDQKETA
jgi:DNA-binding transcriptional ArsR family regulator